MNQKEGSGIYADMSVLAKFASIQCYLAYTSYKVYIVSSVMRWAAKVDTESSFIPPGDLACSECSVTKEPFTSTRFSNEIVAEGHRPSFLETRRYTSCL